MKKKIILLLKISISLLILAYLFKIIPAADIFRSIAAAKPMLVFFGTVAVIPMILLAALQVQYLTKIQGMHISLFNLVRINMTTNFYSFFLPGVLAGGAVKWYKFSQHGNKPAQAFAVIVFNRFVETLAVVMAGIVFSIPELLHGGHHRLFLLWMILLGGMSIAYALLLHPGFLDFLTIYFDRLPMPALIKEKGHKFFSAMHRFQDLKISDHLGIFAILATKHLVGIISFYLLSQSLALQAGLSEMAWVRSIILLLTILPISFSGLGVREGSLVFLLGRYGVAPQEAMAMSFLIFFRNILSCMVGGLLELPLVFGKKTANTPPP